MSAKVVLVGGGGFLGGLIAKALTLRKEIDVSPTEQVPLEEIVVFDVADPKFLPPGVREDSRLRIEKGDLCDKETITRVLDPGAHKRVLVFHTAGILSGQGEKEFDLCLKVNLEGTLALLNCLRAVGEKLGSPQTLVFTSTNAVFAPTECITDTTPVLPFTTYGVTKACCDLLMCDMTRKGFISARIARLPSIIGRPEANSAASNVFSAIFREPLQGRDYECPLPLDTVHPCSYASNLVADLIYLSGKVDTEKLGHNRVVVLPARSFTLQQLLDAAHKAGAKHGLTLGKVSIKEDPEVKRIVDTWPPKVDHSRAVQLGLPDEIEIDQIMEDFVREHVAQK